MTTFPKKFITLVAVDAVSIMIAAALLMRNLWRPAMATLAVLFVTNIFLIPSALRAQKRDGQVSDKGRSKLWFLGFALLTAAFVRLAFFIQSGFSWPGLAGVIAGVLLGTLFLFIAKKSKEVTR